MSPRATYVDIETAQRLLLNCVRPGPVVRMSLADALNRVLAEPIVCDVDYPPFDRAMMDGYAVRAKDLTGGSDAAIHGVQSAGLAKLRVVGQVAAGARYEESLDAGQAVQINTGAPIPLGTDTVVRVEDTELDEENRTVAIKVAPPAGANIDTRAKYLSAGSVVLETGIRLNAGPISVAAAAGATQVRVYRQPHVSVLVTGDELVDSSVKPTGAQLRNSNGPMLRALVQTYHAEAVDLGVAGDDKEVLTGKIRAGLEADVLCITGGISMGAFDFVPEVLEACGVRTVVRKIAIKPGKPTLLGLTESGTIAVALPGNPVSAFVAFVLLAGPTIEAREGQRGRFPAPVTARLVGRCKPTGERQSYWPASVRIDSHGMLQAERLSWHGSGDPFGLGEANGLIVRRAGAAAVSEGDEVSVLPLGRFW